jgi:chromosome segregation ATPase
VPTRRILAEIRDLRVETRDLRGETRDLRAEMRNLRVDATRRDERASELIAEIRGESRLNREVIRRTERVMSDLVDPVKEIKEEARAQAQAIFRLIDRLAGGTAAT